MRSTKSIGFAVCAGAATLMLSGSAFGTLVQNGGFETVAPTLSPGQYLYAPAVAVANWDFNNACAVTYLPSAWDYGRTAPEGNIVAVLQGVASKFSQTISTDAGAYKLSFMQAGRPEFGSSYAGNLTFKVSVDGTEVYTGAMTSSSGFSEAVVPMFTLAAGSHILSFAGSSLTGTESRPDQSAFIDKVSLTAVPEPTTVLAGALLLLPFGASTLRSLRRKA